MGFCPKVRMGWSPDSVKATNGKKYHAGGGGLIVGRLQHTRKMETIGRSRNVPSLTNKHLSSCYFWHQMADCLGAAINRQSNNIINNFAAFLWRSSLTATLTKPCHSWPVNSVLGCWYMSRGVGHWKADDCGDRVRAFWVWNSHRNWYKSLLRTQKAD